MLPYGHVKVVWTCADDCGKLLDRLDWVIREHSMTQRAKIKPLIRRALDRSVVQIESVDVDADLGHWDQCFTDVTKLDRFCCSSGLTLVAEL